MHRTAFHLGVVLVLIAAVACVRLPISGTAAHRGAGGRAARGAVRTDPCTSATRRAAPKRCCAPPTPWTACRTASNSPRFTSGPPQIEALNAGRIDFAITGNTPPGLRRGGQLQDPGGLRVGRRGLR